MSKCKFDYMNFSVDGIDKEFVVHAGKFSKEEAVELFMAENDYRVELNELRKPTEDDFYERYVKYFIHVPDGCDYDTDGGCYTYCSKNDRGNFKVYVVDFADLEVE